jgi:ADP-heptose:LPS heptosyltransferase
MMNTRRKISIDRLIGLPLAWSLNLVARLLGRFPGRDHRITPDNVRTIVVSKYVGMGSIIQATPLIRSLRCAFPGARIIFVTGTSCRRMVERLEHIDQIITVDDRRLFALARTTLRTIAQLMRERIDLYFDLEVYSAYASIIALLSLARNRIGFYRESAHHKKGVYTHLVYFNTRNPIRYVYLQLGRSIGCEPSQPECLGPIRVSGADREESANKLASAGVERGRYLVVNPNASDLMIERRWPIDRFADLIDGLLERHDLSIVLIGSPAERPYVASLAERITHGDRGRVVNLAGELSLGGLFALLEGARGVVTNDTGPMHMAWALEVPTVCLFGPVDPSHYGWSKSGVKVLYSRVYCSPCVHEVDHPPCGGNNVCMQRIDVDRVARAIDEILSSSPANPVQPFEREFFMDPVLGPLGLVVRQSIVGAGRGAGDPPAGCPPEPELAAALIPHATPEPKPAIAPEETAQTRWGPPPDPRSAGADSESGLISAR